MPQEKEPDPHDLQEKFDRLFGHYSHLFKRAKGENVVSADELILIRDFIETCTDLIRDDLDKDLVRVTYCCWRYCLWFWQTNTPPGEENREIHDSGLKIKGRTFESTALIKQAPRKKDYKFSGDDKRFLKALRITPDDSKDGNEKE